MFRRLSNCLVLTVCCIALASGCKRPASPEFTFDQKLSSLSEKLQSDAREQMLKYTGTYERPELLSEKDSPKPDLTRGQAVYQERCVQCHGISGDGNGPAAEFMYPRPRDYRKGLFKFTSTPYGGRPLRDDLIRTVRQGVAGTSMPKFNLLPEQDIQSVVDYVIALSRRGELEQQILETAETESEIDPQLVADELVTTVIRRWQEADESEVFSATPQPKFTTAHVQRGKQAFLTKGCSKCHGDDGRGQTLENRGTDIWGQQTRAADLTSGALHGGQRPIDIYRRIFSGINGTPMPSFRHALQSEPDTIWDLVSYVLSVSNKRREGEIPTPGPIKPYLSEPSASATPAEAASETK